VFPDDMKTYNITNQGFADYGYFYYPNACNDKTLRDEDKCMMATVFTDPYMN